MERNDTLQWKCSFGLFCSTVNCRIFLYFRPFSATRKCEIPGAFRGFGPWTPPPQLTAPPGPQLEIAMTVGNCISCLRHDSPTPPTISHWPAQFCCTPPKNLTTRPTDEPPIKNPPKNLLPAGVLLRVVPVN